MIQVILSLKVIYLGILIGYWNVRFTLFSSFLSSSLFLSAFSWFGLAAQYDFPFDFLLSKQSHFQFVASFDWHIYWYILSMSAHTHIHLNINWNWKFFASSHMFSVPGQQVVHTLHPSSISTAVPVAEAASLRLFFLCLCGQLEIKVKCLRKRLRKMSNS